MTTRAQTHPPRRVLFGLAFVSCLCACASQSAPSASASEAATAPADGSSGQTEAESGNPMLPTALPMQSVELQAADGVAVFADFYPIEQDKPAPIILLFHQAGWNAGEYEPIAPRLQALGFNALATDQRSGGPRNGRTNRTVDDNGESTSFIEAYPDLEAALAWAKDRGHSKILIWGSSYSSALVFKLAAEHTTDVQAVLSFSPGEYIEPDGTVAAWAAKLSLPIFVTSAPGDEAEAAKTILAASPSTNKVQFEPTAGVHGSSILREDANAPGQAAAWTAVEAFLSKWGRS